LLLQPRPASAAVEKTRTGARIVIAGAGAAGLAAASQLSARLDGATITLVDERRAHYYQPGFTLVAGGIKPADYPVSTTAEYVPAGATWLPERVAEIDPDGRKVVTSGGKALPYDFLVVATGLALDYAAIE